MTNTITIAYNDDTTLIIPESEMYILTSYYYSSEDRCPPAPSHAHVWPASSNVWQEMNPVHEYRVEKVAPGTCLMGAHLKKGEAILRVHEDKEHLRTIARSIARRTNLKTRHQTRVV